MTRFAVLLVCAMLALLLCLSRVASGQTCPTAFTIALNNVTQFSVSTTGDATAAANVIATNALKGKTLQLTSQATAPTCDASTQGNVAVISGKTSVCLQSGSTYKYAAVVTEASAWSTISLGASVYACNNTGNLVFAPPAYQIISNRVFMRGCYQGQSTLLTTDTQVTATAGVGVTLPPPPPFTWRQTILAEGLTGLLGAATGVSYITMNPGSSTMTASSAVSIVNIAGLGGARFHLDGISYALS